MHICMCGPYSVWHGYLSLCACPAQPRIAVSPAPNLVINASFTITCNYFNSFRFNRPYPDLGRMTVEILDSSGTIVSSRTVDTVEPRRRRRQTSSLPMSYVYSEDSASLSDAGEYRCRVSVSPGGSATRSLTSLPTPSITVFDAGESRP